MSKWCYNYYSGGYEGIDEAGYNWTRGEYLYNWDDSEYKREREEEEEKYRKEEDKIVNLWKIQLSGNSG